MYRLYSENQRRRFFLPVFVMARLWLLYPDVYLHLLKGLELYRPVGCIHFSSGRGGGVSSGSIGDRESIINEARGAILSLSPLYRAPLVIFALGRALGARGGEGREREGGGRVVSLRHA